MYNVKCISKKTLQGIRNPLNTLKGPQNNIY